MYKLLLADDSTTIQRVIELTFSGEDVDVVSVGDGEQAIVRIPSERPDIVLADIGMPKRNGYDVAAFVKGHAELSHIPVLLLAGAFEPVDEARAEQVGCDGVLVKPFEPQQVIARVHELIERGKGSPSSGIGSVPRPVHRLAPQRAVEAGRAAVAEPPARPPEMPARLPEPAPSASFTPAATLAAPVEIARQAEAPLLNVPPRRSDPFDVAARMGAAASFRLPEPEARHDHTDTLERFAPERTAAPQPIRPVVDQPPRTAAAEPRAPLPVRDPAAAVVPPSDSLDEYFDRLDAAFATLGNTDARGGDGARPGDDDAGLDIPTLDHVLGSGARDARTGSSPSAPAFRQVEPPPPPVAPAAPTVPPTSAPENGGRSLLAQAFNALLAVEQGEPSPGLIRLTKEAPPPVVTEAMVEEVTRRVLLRLSPESVRGVVADIVSDIAERLVREEIQRVRNGG